MDATFRERALGAVLGSACGDALGAGYEFGPPIDRRTSVEMRVGNASGSEPGEWTDDTAMSVPILEAAATGARFDDPRTLGRIVAVWADWAQDAADVGRQTEAVLARLAANTEAAARDAAREVHEQNGRSAGNGSLMRTTPLVLGFLGDGTKRALAASARRVSELTHFEDDAGDACVLWTVAIRHAIRTGKLDVRRGLPMLPKERRGLWLERIAEAEQAEPSDFSDRNRWVVGAFQGAVAAVTGGDGFDDTIERAVRGGNDTDTVAAIAGGLAGAIAGVSEVPERWRLILHGWPGKRADWLLMLASRALDELRPSSGRRMRQG